MDIREMFSKMQSGKVQAHSELGTRDESKQVRNYGTRIQKMKTVTGINARVLVMKDVVLPFNPFTGEPDEVYNDKNKFRPILLVSQVITGIKTACSENSELADIWEKILNHRFEGTEATMEDYIAFKKADFIKPRVMTYHTVALNFGAIYGFSEYRTKYTVDPSQLNENNSYDYGKDAPVWHKAAAFFNTMLRPEIDEVTKKLQRDGANKEKIASARSDILAKSPVSFVGPTNLLPFFFFPHSEKPRTFDPTKPKEVEQCLRYYGYTDKWNVPLQEAATNPMFDTDMDFFDFTIKTAAPGSTKQNGQVYTDNDSFELYASMTIASTDGRLAIHGGSTFVDGETFDNNTAYASFFETARAYFLASQEASGQEGGETFEKIMAASNRFRPITSVMENFLLACNDMFTSSFANTPYFTEQVKKANSDFLVMMNPQNALALAAEDEEDLEAAAEQQKASVDELISMSRAADATQGASDDALGTSDIQEVTFME